jgi:hypothetical protein
MAVTSEYHERCMARYDAEIEGLRAENAALRAAIKIGIEALTRVENTSDAVLAALREAQPPIIR